MSYLQPGLGARPCLQRRSGPGASPRLHDLYLNLIWIFGSTLLDETARTLQRWVNSEPRIRLARYVELRVILRRGLRNWAIIHSWWKEAKERILAHTLYRPGGSGFIEVARTTLVGKKRDTRDE